MPFTPTSRANALAAAIVARNAAQELIDGLNAIPPISPIQAAGKAKAIAEGALGAMFNIGQASD